MPELPEVEVVRRTLAPHLLERTIVGVEVRNGALRAVVPAAALQHELVGERVVGLRRRGKYLLFDTTGRAVMLCHLGMTGHLRVAPADQPWGRHDHVVWHLDNGIQMRFHDPRRFGLVEVMAKADESTHPRLRHLGLEPLGSDCTGAWLFNVSRGLGKPAKNFLMDAHHVVGVGNIYANEALFAAGIDPAKPIGSLGPKRCTRLIESLKNILDEAIRCGGTTISDFADAAGKPGYFAPQLRVYGRAGSPCCHCHRTVKKRLLAGRSSFYCTRCQT